MLKSTYPKFAGLLAVCTTLWLGWANRAHGFSPAQLVLTGLPLVLLALILFLVNRISCIKNGAASAERSNFPEITASAGLLIGLAALLLAAVAFFYFDNPEIDLVIRLIRQVIPLLLFLFAAGAGLFIAVYKRFSPEGPGERGSLRKMLYHGRIVWQWAFLGIICLIILAAYLPVRRNYSPSFDSSIFSYIGQQILKGKTPYLQAWDHKPALIFYVNALGLWLAGGHLIGVWILEFLALFLGSVILFHVFKKYFSESLSLLAISLSMLHLIRLLDFGNYTEELSLFIQIAALGLAFSRFAVKQERIAWGLSGVLCGLTFTSKQNTIGIWLSLFCCAAIPLFSDPARFRQEIGRFLRNLCWFGGGFLLVNLVWTAFFYSQGALKAYWDTAFVYNFVYSQKSAESRWATWGTTLTFVPGISVFMLMAFLSWFVLLADVFIRLKDQRTRIPVFQNNRLLILGLFWLPAELLMAGISGMNYQHYFILCVPPAAIIAAYFGRRMNALLTIGMRRSRAILATSLYLIVAAASLLPLFREAYQPRNPSAMTKAAAFLRENSLESDPIQLWGGSVAPYVLSDRSSSSRYFNVRPLYLISGYLQTEQWAQFLSGLQAAPPKFIIYMHDRFINRVPKISDGFCRAEVLQDYQQATFDFLCRNYRLREFLNEGMNDEWSVFERIP